MIEIKTIGRGGQGAVTFSQLLAIAAFEQGFPVVQAMPVFGVERRGAPSSSFTRLSKEICTGLRSQIYKPDIIVVLDATLVKDLGSSLTEGLKKEGLLIINTAKSVNELGISGFKIIPVDATKIAKEIFKADLVNTAMLGAFARATSLITLESLYKALEQRFEGNISMIEKNKQAIKEVYAKCQV